MLNPLCYSLFAELPEEGPLISGGLPDYQLNDRLELNCTSQRTFPPTLLKWYINSEPVSANFIYYIHYKKIISLQYFFHNRQSNILRGILINVAQKMGYFRPK